MKIIKTFPETLDRRDAYRLTKAQSAHKIQDAAGTVLNPDKWVLFEDEDRTGEVKTVLTLGKALSNIAYKYKEENGLAPTAKVELDKIFLEVEEL